MKVSLFEETIPNTTLDDLPTQIANGRAYCYNMVKGTVIERLAKRIMKLIEENRRLTFWFSTSMLMVGAPQIFYTAAAVGLLSATQNHFGLRERRIQHLSWESTQGLMSGIVFVCGMIFQYHLQAVWGGFAFGSHTYRLWNGQGHANRLHGFAALDHEMHLLTEEFGKWLKWVLPCGQAECRRHPQHSEPRDTLPLPIRA